MELREETRVVLLLDVEVGFLSASPDANARVKVDVRSVTNRPDIELNGFVHTEDGELLQQVAKEFCTDFCAVRKGVFGVLVGDHDVNRKFSDFGFEQVVVHVDGELVTHIVDGVLDQPVDVGAGENVVRFLVVDFVHHRVDDEQRDQGKREGDEGHPPSWNAGRTTGQHGGFTAAAQLSTHQDVAPVAEVLHRPTGARSSVLNPNLGVFVIVDKGEEGERFLGDVMFKLHALGNGLHNHG